jgi:hypothetical protein
MGQDRGEQVGLQIVPVVDAARAELDAGLEVREHLLGLIERAFDEVRSPPALALAELDGTPHQRGLPGVEQEGEQRAKQQDDARQHQREGARERPAGPFGHPGR